jgi:hypothetical protein
MPKVITLYKTGCFTLPEIDMSQKRNSLGLSTADYRRILSELKNRPPSQRAFFRKLLVRALAMSAPAHLPVTHHVVPDPVVPT